MWNEAFTADTHTSRTNPIFYYCFDSTIDGRIDQVNQVLELTKGAEGAARYTALDRWTNQLQYLQSVIVTKMN